MECKYIHSNEWGKESPGYEDYAWMYEGGRKVFSYRLSRRQWTPVLIHSVVNGETTYYQAKNSAGVKYTTHSYRPHEYSKYDYCQQCGKGGGRRTVNPRSGLFLAEYGISMLCTGCWARLMWIKRREDKANDVRRAINKLKTEIAKCQKASALASKPAENSESSSACVSTR
jgi:hypothetical protein